MLCMEVETNSLCGLTPTLLSLKGQREVTAGLIRKEEPYMSRLRWVEAVAMSPSAGQPERTALNPL